MDLYTFLKRLSKVSLHVHLAGSVQPSTLVALASKSSVALPAYREPEDLYDYPDIYQFLKMFDLVIASVRDRADFHRITYETLQQAAEHGVRHREMFWNPTNHMACGVPYATAVDGIIDGIRDARTDFGIQCVLIAAINRMGAPELGLEMVQTMLAHPREEVVGVGMGRRARAAAHGARERGRAGPECRDMPGPPRVRAHRSRLPRDRRRADHPAVHRPGGGLLVLPALDSVGVLRQRPALPPDPRDGAAGAEDHGRLR
jgi:hypothetical protein